PLGHRGSLSGRPRRSHERRCCAGYRCRAIGHQRRGRPDCRIDALIDAWARIGEAGFRSVAQTLEECPIPLQQPFGSADEGIVCSDSLDPSEDLALADRTVGGSVWRLVRIAHPDSVAHPVAVGYKISAPQAAIVAYRLPIVTTDDCIPSKSESGCQV